MVGENDCVGWGCDACAERAQEGQVDGGGVHLGSAGSAGGIPLGLNISPSLPSELRGSYAYLDQEKSNQGDCRQKVSIMPSFLCKGLPQTGRMADYKLSHQ